MANTFVSVIDANNATIKMAVQSISGSINVSQVQLFDGTSIATIKAASTAPVAADPALVVAVSPNSPTGTSSFPVQGAVAQGSAILGNPLLCGATFTTTPATLTSGQQATLQTDNAQNLLTKINVALPAGTNALGTVKLNDGTNGQLSGSITNLAALTSINSMLVTGPGTWSVFNQATAGTPTISKALVSVTRHVCQSVSISVAAAGTAQPAVIVNLRDGATGAGTILRTWALSAPINSAASIAETGLNIVGSSGVAMTLEFAGTTAAAVVGSVNMSGYDAT